MSRLVVFEAPLITYQVDERSGFVYWSYAGLDWVWTPDGYLHLGANVGDPPLTCIKVREHAMQFSLGFTAGRRLDFFACEALKVTTK